MSKNLAPSFSERVFKGWTKPGPLLNSVSEIEEGETLDAISGSYRLYQYKDGHRFSTDDLLVAWFGTTYSVRAEKVLDLGSGIGSVGMMAAWRLPHAKFVTVEAQEVSIRLAEKSRRFNGLEDRYEIRSSDFREDSWKKPGETFDLILGSPPYFPLTDGVVSEHPQKVACRFEVRGSVIDYCLAASSVLAPGGMFFVVFPRIQEDRTLQGAREAGLRVLRNREIIFREGETPLLGLYQMGRESDFPSSLFEKIPERGWSEPSLTIRSKNGEVHPEYSVVKLSIGFPP